MAAATLETLQLLESRVHRLEHFLARRPRAKEDVKESGPPSGTHSNTAEDSVFARVKSLDARMAEISSNNPAARALLQLRKDLPQLFVQPSADTEDITPAESLTHKLQIVQSTAPEINTMVSNLSTLHQYPLPNASELSTLLNTHERLARFEAIQDMQVEEMSHLRTRTIALLHEWYQDHVLESGQRWSTYEDRLVHVETTVLRKESANDRDEESE